MARVLTINPRYFGLTMGLERRLYELARKHLGQQPSWQISLPRLAEKCGSRREVRKLEAGIVCIIEGGSLADYSISFPLPPARAAARPPHQRGPGLFQPPP